MENLEKNDARITLRDVFFYVLRGWRLAVVLILCCAVLFGAFRALRLISMIRSAGYQDQARELYDQAVEYRESETERLDREIGNQEKWLKTRNEYIEKSLLMEMDPNDSWIISADVVVSGDTGVNDGYLLANIYQSALSSKVFRELADATHIEEKYLQEIFRVSYTNYYQTPIVEPKEAVWVTDSTLMHIALIAGDEETAEKYMNGIIASLKNLNKQLNEGAQLELHNNLAVMNLTCVNRRVDELDAYQSGVQNEVKNVSSYLKSLQKEKDELEIPVYELMPLSSVLLSCLKYSALGAFVGVFLSLIVLVLACIYSDKPLSPSELRTRTGMRVFALSKEARRRFGGWIDREVNHRELNGELLSTKTLKRVLELDNEVSQYFIWGNRPEETLASIIPENKPVTDIEELDSWRSLLSSGEEGGAHRRFILFADRKKTTYKELMRKLEVIKSFTGEDVVCVFYV